MASMKVGESLGRGGTRVTRRISPTTEQIVFCHNNNYSEAAIRPDIMQL